MGVIRNFIDIEGITPEQELPDKITGQLIEYSEVEHIYIPNDKPRIYNIQNISIKIDITSSRIINAPLGKIVVLDGLKSFKITYTQRGHNERASIVDLDLPYNTFIEIPKDRENMGSAHVYVADAYFKVIDSRKIYSYILYVINVS